jgi:co-chaperonin GroES (HSP10)|tara:strand:+ start:363 stop:599 length:237 start_codon:yes stop_codon:yes gene_type:complete
MIVKTIKEQKKIAGLDILDSIDSENRYLKGEIISNGDLIPETLQEGDVVYYDKHAGHSITKDDNIYQVIQIQDVVIVE